MKRAVWLAQSLGVILASGILVIGVDTPSSAGDGGNEPKCCGSSSRHPDDKSIRITVFCPSDTVVKINHATMLASGTRREFRSRVDDAGCTYSYQVEVNRRQTTSNTDGTCVGAAWPKQRTTLWLKAGESRELFYDETGLYRFVAKECDCTAADKSNDNSTTVLAP